MEVEGEEEGVEEEEGGDEYDGEEGEDYDVNELEEELEIEEGDEDALRTFMGLTNGRSSVNLADLILDKIREKEMMEGAAGGVKEGGGRPALNPKIVEVYTSVGKLLTRYKSGKLPKPFKVIPALSNWEEVRYITHHVHVHCYIYLYIYT